MSPNEGRRPGLTAIAVLLLAARCGGPPPATSVPATPAAAAPASPAPQPGLLLPPRERPAIELGRLPADAPELALWDDILPSGRYFDVVWEGNEIWAASLRGVDHLIWQPPDRLERIRHTSLAGHTQHVELLPGDRLLTGDDYAGLGLARRAGADLIELARLPTAASCRSTASVDDITYAAVHAAGLLAVRRAGDRLEVLQALDTGGRTFDVALAGPLLLAADGPGGLAVFRRAADGRLTPAGRCPEAGWALQVRAAGGLAYVADRDYGLRVIDLADPDRPSLAGALALPGQTRAVALGGALAAAASDQVLAILDLADPRRPAQLAAIAPVNEFRSVSLAGTRLAAADGDAGVRVFDLARPAEPQPAGELLLRRLVADVARADRCLVVAAGLDGLRTVLPEGRQLRLAGRLEGPGNVVAVECRGDLAAVADTDGLALVSVADPGRPQLIARLDTPGRASGVSLQGNLALVADWFEGVQVIDIADPARPRLLATVDTPGWVVDVLAAGRYAYAAAVSGGIVPIDLADPARPQTGRLLARPAGPEGLALAGDLLYAADFNDGLAIVDVREPMAPRLIDTIDTGLAKGVQLAGGRLYLANYMHGVKVFSLADPRRPRLAAAYDTPGKAYDLVVLADSLVVADWHGLIRLGVPAGP